MLFIIDYHIATTNIKILTIYLCNLCGTSNFDNLVETIELLNGSFDLLIVEE